MKTITVNTVIPPAVIESLDIMLLDPLLGMYRRFEKLVVRAEKKIRAQDVGKRRDFDKMSRQFEEVYERKKAEEAEYKKSVKEASQKRPCLSATGSTLKFKRFQREKQDYGDNIRY